MNYCAIVNIVIYLTFFHVFENTCYYVVIIIMIIIDDYRLFLLQCHIVGLDIFSGKKHENIFGSTCDVKQPSVTKRDMLVRIDNNSTLI